jgi:hypothetical protein
MPAVPAPAKVLVSGVNGYVGIWVARRYLEHGYSVRGTVRSIERAGKHLRDTFASYGDKFELVEVADITAVRVSTGLSVDALLIGPAHRSAHSTRLSRASMSLPTLYATPPFRTPLEINPRRRPLRST